MSAGAMLEVRHLRLVRAIAEEGGPTRAAARLHLTQSAVSHQLAELEGRLGVALFARVRRRLTPTPAGARLVEEARGVLGELARIERDLHRAGEKRRAVVRIVLETFTAYPWMPSVVAALAEEAPHVELRVALEATREPVAALLRGAVDVAVVSSPVSGRALASTPLWADEWAVALAPGHPLSARPFLSAGELGTQTLFAHDSPRSDVERLRTLLANERAPMPRVQTVPLTDLIIDLVKAGLGVGLLSRWACAPYEARGDVVWRRLTRKGVRERWTAWTRRDASPDVARVVEVVRARGGPARRGR